MLRTYHLFGLFILVVVLTGMIVLSSPPSALAQLSDFSLSVSPSSLSIEQGSSSSVSVTVTSYGDFSSPVQLDVSGLPSGVSANLSPNPVTPPAGDSAYSQVSLSVDSQVPAGSYPLTISGVAMPGQPPHESSLTLTVTSSGPPPDFDMSVTPSSMSVQQGGSDSATVTITPIGDFSSAVSLSSDGAPYGVDLSFNPSQVVIAPGSSPQSTVTIIVSSTAPIGSYPITIGGSAGGGRTPHYCTLNLVVTSSGPPPDFDVSVSPSSLQIQQGSYATTTLSVSIVGSFSSTIYFSSNGAPSGAAVNFSPASLTPTPGSGLLSTVTVSVSSTTPTGSYPITLTGSTGYGGTSHDCSLYLTVTSSGPQPDFTISVSPSSISIQQGNGGTTTLTIIPIGGFSSTVSLSASGTPSGVSVNFSPRAITPNIGGSLNSILSISVSNSASTGTFSLTLRGTVSSGQSHSSVLVLVVTSGRASDFTLSVVPTSVTMQPGGNAQAVVTVSSIAGFASLVSLSLSNIPSGLSANFGPNPITPSSGPVSSTLTLTLSSSAPSGTYTVSITGSSASTIHTCALTLIINQRPAQDFSFSTSSQTVAISAGSTSTLVLSTSSINGFSSSIQFASVWLGSKPTGLTVNNPTPIPLSSGVTVSANLLLISSLTTPPGTYTLQVTASGSGFSHSLTISVQVNSSGDFAIQLSASQVTLTPGSHTTVIATIQSTSGFSSPVSLSHSPLEDVALSYNSPVTPARGDAAIIKILVEAPAQAKPNVWTATLIGESRGVSHSVDLTIVISQAASPDFSVSSSATTLHITQGTSDSATLTINSQGGFSSNVQLSAAWLGSVPSGVTFTLPTPITPMANLYASTVLKVTANSNVQGGTYTLRVTSQSGQLMHTVDMNVDVTSGVTTATIVTTTNSSAETPTIAYVIPVLVVIAIILTALLLRGRKRN